VQNTVAGLVLAHA